jgi:hypothetical protein
MMAQCDTQGSAAVGSIHVVEMPHNACVSLGDLWHPQPQLSSIHGCAHPCCCCLTNNLALPIQWIACTGVASAIASSACVCTFPAVHPSVHHSKAYAGPVGRV